MDDAPDALPRLADGPAFNLLLAANLLARPFVERIAPVEDLSLPEWRCMMALAARPDMANVEVAHETGLDVMTVSRALARLARARRIGRRRDAADGRRTVSRLTPEGAATYRRLAAGAQARMTKVFGALTPQEVESFKAMLDKMVARLREAEG